MAESPRRVDLRLTISTGSPYLAVAAELTGKFAEYAGANAAAAKGLAHDVGSAINQMADAAPAAHIEIELSAQDRQVVVTTNSGDTTTRASCPLPD
jgi:hypothetical protein